MDDDLESWLRSQESEDDEPEGDQAVPESPRWTAYLAEASPERQVSLWLMRAQFSQAREGRPKARQRYPDLPNSMFSHGKLESPSPLLKDGVWEFRVKNRTLTGENLRKYAKAYQEITGRPLEVPSAASGT